MRSQGGFTLIEIMVVVLIIGLLAAVVGPRIIGFVTKGEAGATKIQIRNLETALKQFRIDNGFYPETQQGLEALIIPPTVGRQVKAYQEGGYLEGERVPLDGWKNSFVYIGPDQTQNGSYEVISPGEDGVLQTEDDISSRNIQ